MAMYRGLIAVALLTAVAGCSSSASSSLEVREVMADQRYARQIPGVAEYVWEEPMVDVIDNPPGLDPEGNYYRPGHESVVEIRQGRWRHYRDQ